MGRYVRIALVGIGLVLLSGSLLMVRSGHLIHSNWMPKCLFHLMTGWYCPGCGLTRAVHALLNGDVLQAFAYNALWLLVLLVVIPILARIVWYWMLGTRPVKRTTTRVWLVGGMLMGGLVVSFGLFRNLPGKPWQQLAPHKLL